MTEHDQIKALAELDESLYVIHKPIHDPFGYYRKDACGYCGLSDAWRVTYEVGLLHIGGRSTDPDRVILEPAPKKPYLTSYDTIIPLIQKQSKKVRDKVRYNLSHGCSDLDEHFDKMLTCTRAQLCEALLRATGKWVE